MGALSQVPRSVTALLLAVPAAACHPIGAGNQVAVATSDRSDAPFEFPMVQAPSNDAELNAAIRDARRNLPHFWKVFDSHPAGVDIYSLKVDYPTLGGGDEFIWVDITSHDANSFVGTIGNTPKYRLDLKLGMQVRVNDSSIADWSYTKDGKIFGHYTTRVLLKYMRPMEAADVRAELSPTPIEPGAS